MSNYFFNIFYNKIITQFFLIFFLTLPVQAIEKTEVNRLVQVLNLKDLFQELQNEGVTAGIEMLKEEGQQSQEWVSKLNEIYSSDSMQEFFRNELLKLNIFEDVENAVDFYETTFGKKLIKNELTTRKVLKSELGKAEAKKIFNQLKYFKPNRLKVYQKIIEENHYIEDNVSSSMNSNLAFYQGYSLSLPSDKQRLLEAEIISKIWANEIETRKRMTEWVMSFTSYNYKDLTNNELNNLLDFSKSLPSKRLNNTINYILDKAFEDQSYRLGQAFATLSEQGGA
ncbi:MAG: hypothetical protein CML44_05750 [Rhodobacteraceae bacterium]|nr:hypothetical protein [Paracoccaceae bacterium]